MPDLTTQYFWECSTVESYLTKVGEHFVSVRRWQPNGWHCTCSSFKYKRFAPGQVYCKHILEAQKDYCGWMQFIAGGEVLVVDGDRKCPHCERKAISRSWGV